MKVIRSPDGTLTVTSVETMMVLLAVLLPAFDVMVWVLASTREALWWTLGLGVGTLACLAGCEWTRFSFDPAARRLTWARRTPFRRSSGTVPFADITSLSLEQAFNQHGGRSNTRRLVVHATGGVIPVTNSYSTGKAGLQRTAEAIRDTLRAGDPGREIPIVV